MFLMLLFFIGLVILSIPLLLGPLRRGLVNVLISVTLLIIYLFVLVFTYFLLSENSKKQLTSSYEVKSLDPLLFLFIVISVILIGSILITILCFFLENYRHEGKQETFYDEKLFYRYGQRVKSDIIPIGVKQNRKSTDELARNLYFHLSKNMKQRFGVNHQLSTNIINVSDSNFKGDDRLFIKLKFLTIRGSCLSYFINLQSIGNQIAVSSIAHIKSRYYWHHVLVFIVFAPIHYWFWIYHWLMDKFSLQSSLGYIDVDNTFEKLDLEAYLKSASFAIMGAIEDFAKENGLLTEELKQLIIQNNNNTQNINIRKSRGIRISKLKINSNT